MKKTALLATLLASSIFALPAHAGKGGLVADLFTLGQNVFNGTIPLPYTLGFLVLVAAIVILGVMEARKNARKEAEAQAQNGSVSLDK